MSYNDNNYGRDPYGTSKKGTKAADADKLDAAEDPAAAGKDNCPCDATSGQPQKKKTAKAAAAPGAEVTGEEAAAEEGAVDASISVGDDKATKKSGTPSALEAESSKLARLLEKAGAVLHGGAKVLEGQGKGQGGQQ